MGTIANWKNLERFLRLEGPNHRVYLTCSNTHDGLGSQAMRVMSVIAYCRARGITYIHSPFEEVWGAPGDPQYSARCENFIGLGQGEPRLSDMARTPQPVVKALEGADVFDGKCVLLSIRSMMFIIRREPSHFISCIPLFRARFGFERHLAAAPSTPPRGVRIVAHIRRGDVSLARHPGRFTDNDVYLSAFRAIREAMRPVGLTPCFEVYSQGAIEEFEAFGEFDATLRINTPLLEDIARMATADVLLIAKSGLSYMAAVYSTGVKLFQPFWMDPLPGWIPYGPDTPFPAEQFVASLAENAAERAIRQAWRA